jgi:hypothetical protein
MKSQDKAERSARLSEANLKINQRTADLSHNFLCPSDSSQDFEIIAIYIRYADSPETGKGAASRSIYVAFSSRALATWATA